MLQTAVAQGRQETGTAIRLLGSRLDAILSTSAPNSPYDLGWLGPASRRSEEAQSREEAQQVSLQAREEPHPRDASEPAGGGAGYNLEGGLGASASGSSFKLKSGPQIQVDNLQIHGDNLKPGARARNSLPVSREEAASGRHNLNVDVKQDPGRAGALSVVRPRDRDAEPGRPEPEGHDPVQVQVEAARAAANATGTASGIRETNGGRDPASRALDFASSSELQVDGTWHAGPGPAATVTMPVPSSHVLGHALSGVTNPLGEGARERESERERRGLRGSAGVELHIVPEQVRARIKVFPDTNCTACAFAFDFAVKRPAPYWRSAWYCALPGTGVSYHVLVAAYALATPCPGPP